VDEQVLTLTGVPMAKANETVEITRVPLSKIKLSRNSRMDVSQDELDGLMQSIKEVGLLQPIGLIKKGPNYEIAYGNRRYLACSKLGLSRIPAIVRSEKREFDVDIQNLTENIQRRNLGLAEVGRYMKLLESEGLSRPEIAVRLGVPRSYVTHCFDAFERVPKEFRNDIEVRVASDKKGQTQSPGKISIRQAQAIISAKKSHRLDDKKTEALFRAAKSLGSEFKIERIHDYAGAVKAGKDPVKQVPKHKMLHLAVLLSEAEFERLEAKHVDNGPFKSVTAVARAILSGKIADRITTIE